MYALLSLVLSLVIAFALSGLFNFFIVWIIAFFSLYLITTYIDTIVRRQNKVLNLFFEIIKDLWDQSDFSGYYFFLLLIPPVAGIAGAVVVLVGGPVLAASIITAPIWQFLYTSNTKVRRMMFIAITVLVLVGLYFYGALLLINPVLVYRYLHFGILIGAFVAAAVITLALTIYYKVSGKLKTGYTVTLSVAEVGLIPLFVCGLVLSMSATYSLTVAEDMNVFINAPIGYDTAIVLENDLDFTDKKVRWYGACGEFKGVFDGKGHKISNVTYSGEFEKSITHPYYYDYCHLDMSFVQNNMGIIRNITFENCKITVKKLDVNTAGIQRTHINFRFIGSGKIENCTLIDCQAKYCVELIGKGEINNNCKMADEGTTVITQNIDEDFYNEPCPIPDKSWQKIN